MLLECADPKYGDSHWSKATIIIAPDAEISTALRKVQGFPAGNLPERYRAG